MVPNESRVLLVEVHGQLVQLFIVWIAEVPLLRSCSATKTAILVRAISVSF